MSSSIILCMTTNLKKNVAIVRIKKNIIKAKKSNSYDALCTVLLDLFYKDIKLLMFTHRHNQCHHRHEDLPSGSQIYEYTSDSRSALFHTAD